jgi:hypothetical protein
MILRILSLLASSSLLRYVHADIAPEITTLAEGYNILAKLPCVNCPFLYQDTASGENKPWGKRQDGNALVFPLS